MKLTSCGFWPVAQTREQVVHLGPSTLMLTACHFAGWGNVKDPAAAVPACLRSAGGRLIVNGCEFMQEKPQLLLEKGLKAATITGNLFRGDKAVVNDSGVEVQIGLNSTH